MVPPRREPGIHRYAVHCRWSGSTGAGYEAYDRGHDVRVSPGAPALRLSADPVFRGDARLPNPEQLVVAAVVSCQCLSFLAVAARARLDVRSYEDEGEGVMPETESPLRLTAIMLHPRIRVAPGTAERRVLHLVEVAHRECYVANSLRTDIRIEPTVIIDPS
jgi:organic hydroperoxide reductase OsmC/OhrA